MLHGDYYSLLEIPRCASHEEIKQAYRRLVRKWHPDLNPGVPDAEDRLKRLNEAYRVLRDHESRHNYDRMIFASLSAWNASYVPDRVRAPKSVIRRRRVSLAPLVASLVVLAVIVAVAASWVQPANTPLEWRSDSHFPADRAVTGHITITPAETEAEYLAAANYWEREMQLTPRGDLARLNLADMYGRLASLAESRGDMDQAKHYSEAARALFPTQEPEESPKIPVTSI